MQEPNRLHELRDSDRMRWLDDARAWRAEPDEVMNALAADGFQECKREIARVPRAQATGGVWQGIDPRTGIVASTIWTRDAAGAPIVFIAINDQPLQGR